MGRTLPTANMAALLEEERWRDFRRALRREDRELFDDLWVSAKHHIQAGQFAGSLVPFHAMLLSMMLEVKKENRALQRELDEQKKRWQNT
jgi:hypothetical protein